MPSSYGAERYATIVRDRSLMREIIRRSADIRSMALDETRTPGDVIEKLEQDVFDIAAQRFHGRLWIARDAAVFTRDMGFTPDYESGALDGDLAAKHGICRLRIVRPRPNLDRTATAAALVATDA